MSASIRKAFVLGAGLGTRLRHLTARKPKPLIPICGKPLITFAFDHLLRNGVEELIVNTHHCPECYGEAFPHARYRGAPLHFEHEPALLETAGGLKNAAALLRDETFLVYNGDILSDLPIERAVQHHFEHGNEVTLVLRSSGGPLHIALDESSGSIRDIANRLTTGAPSQHMFTGIYVVSPPFLERVAAQTKISVIPIFLKMIQEAQKLGGIVIDEGHWWDLGTREKYLEVHRYFAEQELTFVSDGLEDGDAWPQWIHPSAKIASSANINGLCALGAGAQVGERAQLTDCVLWENAQVAPDAILRHCIVTAGQRASGTHADFDF